MRREMEALLFLCLVTSCVPWSMYERAWVARALPSAGRQSRVGTDNLVREETKVKRQ